MTFTAASKLGKILRSPVAAEALFAAAPEMRDSPYLDLVRGLSLERLVAVMGRDQAWLEGVLAALEGVPEVAKHDEVVVPSPEYESGDVPAGSALRTGLTRQIALAHLRERRAAVRAQVTTTSAGERSRSRCSAPSHAWAAARSAP